MNLTGAEISRRRRGSAELRPEYDFSLTRPNKYAARYAKGSIVGFAVTDFFA